MARSRRSRERLSAAEARRVALAAQGFADGRPARPDGRALRRVLKQVGLLQIDSVNVLARGHHLTLFGRLGPYPLEPGRRHARRNVRPRRDVEAIRSLRDPLPGAAAPG